jgi:hypothetical protein
LNTEIRGHDPRLALQVSGVSDFFGSLLNCVFALPLSWLLLLDWLCNQLVDYFARSIYTYEKDAMQQLEEQRCNKLIPGAPDAMQGN